MPPGGVGEHRVVPPPGCVPVAFVLVGPDNLYGRRFITETDDELGRWPAEAEAVVLVKES
jgi:hypothetical protein